MSSQIFIRSTMHCVSSIYTITYQVLLRLSPINLNLTFMKTPINKPPPFKNGVFALIFYLHFSTAQNRYNMYSEFIINFNTPNLRRWIIAVKHTHIFSNLLIHTKTNVYPLVCIPYFYPYRRHIRVGFPIIFFNQSNN